MMINSSKNFILKKIMRSSRDYLKLKKKSIQIYNVNNLNNLIFHNSGIVIILESLIKRVNIEKENWDKSKGGRRKKEERRRGSQSKRMERL